MGLHTHTITGWPHDAAILHANAKLQRVTTVETAACCIAEVEPDPTYATLRTTVSSHFRGWLHILLKQLCAMLHRVANPITHMCAKTNEILQNFKLCQSICLNFSISLHHGRGIRVLDIQSIHPRGESFSVLTFRWKQVFLSRIASCVFKALVSLPQHTVIILKKLSIRRFTFISRTVAQLINSLFFLFSNLLLVDI